MSKDWSKLLKLFSHVETVTGVCPECHEQTMLISIVSDYYRCTSCGEDIKQHINGSIRYFQLDDKDKQWLKENPSSE